MFGGGEMKFSTITKDFFDLVSFDNELLHNEDEKRPYLIILRLKYKGKKQDFALPFRSNIAGYIPKEQYYSLPPRSTTKKGYIHGLHYIKMFPLNKKYLQKYNVNDFSYFKTVQIIIETNMKEIVDAAQTYLTNYESGVRTSYCVDIDKIYNAISINEIIEASEAMKEIVVTTE